MRPIMGDPEAEHISTSYVERANPAIRMQNHHFTRLTNGFSKKIKNLQHSVSLTFMHYNLCGVHQTLHVTPAMAAGLTDHVWDIADLIALMPKPVAGAWGSVKGGAANA
jgi:hypothetical protein